MIEGLFAVQFTANMGNFGRGVVTFLPNGKVYGGDGDYFYQGSLQEDEEQVKGQITVANHSGALHSVFGPVRSFTLVVSGHAAGPNFVLMGEVVEMRGMQLRINCRKVSDL